MNFRKFLEARYNPKDPKKIIDGSHYAIIDMDGIVYYFPDSDNHYDVIRRSRVPMSKIAATGWLDDGEFRPKPWGDPFQTRSGYSKDEI